MHYDMLSQDVFLNENKKAKFIVVFMVQFMYVLIYLCELVSVYTCYIFSERNNGRLIQKLMKIFSYREKRIQEKVGLEANVV